jgi:hypothetical protein
VKLGEEPREERDVKPDAPNMQPSEPIQPAAVAKEKPVEKPFPLKDSKILQALDPNHPRGDPADVEAMPMNKSEDGVAPLLANESKPEIPEPAVKKDDEAQMAEYVSLIHLLFIIMLGMEGS